MSNTVIKLPGQEPINFGAGPSLNVLDQRYASIVKHLDNPNVARPSTPSSVIWVGSVVPNQIADGDVYLIATTEPIPAPWTPIMLTGIKGWYDPQELELAEGATVTSFPERINGADAVANTGAPTFSNTAVNGTPGVVFDGSSSLKTAEFTAQTGPLTIFFNAYASGPATQYIVDGPYHTSLGVYRSIPATNFGFRRGGSVAVGGPAASGDSNVHSFVCIFNGATSRLEIDGEQYVSGEVGTSSITALTFGARGGDNQQGLIGAIGDYFWMTGVPDVDELAQATQWLQQRAGLL